MQRHAGDFIASLQSGGDPGRSRTTTAAPKRRSPAQLNGGPCAGDHGETPTPQFAFLALPEFCLFPFAWNPAARPGGRADKLENPAAFNRKRSPFAY